MVGLCQCLPGRLQTALEATIANSTGLQEPKAAIHLARDVAAAPAAAVTGCPYAWWWTRTAGGGRMSPSCCSVVEISAMDGADRELQLCLP